MNIKEKVLEYIDNCDNNEPIFMDDIKKSDTEKINQLYYISLELKQQDRFEEIQKLAAEIKKGLKSPLKK